MARWWHVPPRSLRKLSPHNHVVRQDGERDDNGPATEHTPDRDSIHCSSEDGIRKEDEDDGKQVPNRCHDGPPYAEKYLPDMSKQAN